MTNENTLKTISFFGTVLAGAEKTLISQRISTPFIFKRAAIAFSLNTNRSVKIKIFISLDGDAPTTGEPSGYNILDEYGQVDYVKGDDEKKIIENHTIFPDSGAYLKIYANNSDGFNHTIDVQAIIELLERT